mmetsp:Transcript_26425/g.60387  ORF Transcript_26425/g.60387 Transcript_26425/m.60387 type:complete len:217 (-) Transcript_26425:1226-1876(-)
MSLSGSTRTQSSSSASASIVLERPNESPVDRMTPGRDGMTLGRAASFVNGMAAPSIGSAVSEGTTAAESPVPTGSASSPVDDRAAKPGGTRTGMTLFLAASLVDDLGTVPSRSLEPKYASSGGGRILPPSSSRAGPSTGVVATSSGQTTGSVCEGVGSARDEVASAADSVTGIGSTTDEEAAGADSATGVGSAIDEGTVVSDFGDRNNESSKSENS